MDAPTGVAAEISARLRTERFGRPLSVHGSVTSTSDFARDLARSGAAEGTAVLALEQTHGRGRLGRPWVSPPGGVYVSLVLRPAIPVDRWPLIGLACALGAAAAAEAHAGAPVRVKWPNDLLLDEGKVGGILVEVAGDAAVCGIGLNVIPTAERSPTFDSPASRPARSGTSWNGSEGSVDNPPGGVVMSTKAAWLAMRNSAVSVAAVVADILFECERRYATLGTDPGAILMEWRARTETLGRTVRVEAAEPFDGVAEDIDTDGALLVRTTTGLRRVLAGDVVATERSR